MNDLDNIVTLILYAVLIILATIILLIILYGYFIIGSFIATNMGLTGLSWYAVTITMILLLGGVVSSLTGDVNLK